MSPTPCPCRECVGGCRWSIAVRAPWTLCKACGVRKKHRVHGA